MSRGIRDALKSIVPIWLANRAQKNVGFRVLYVAALLCDVLWSYAVAGIYTWFPGYAIGATNLSVDQESGLEMTGRSRGYPRGIGEASTTYAARMRVWLDDWKDAAATVIVLKMIRGFLGGTPRLRMIDRSGNWTTLETNGTITRTVAAWNWDGVSNPERAGMWSDVWIVVYPDQFGQRPGTLGGLTGDDGLGLGMLIRHADADTLRGILQLWKGAHTFLRAVIFTTDATLFDPSNPSTCPDGKWGQWSNVNAGNDSRVASGRNITTCRYLEPEVTP